jgi:hypothetical protein
LAQYYGANYNFLIRAEVRGERRPAVTITSLTIPDGMAGTMYKEELAADGGTPPYTWDVTSGTLPNGMTLDASTGEISGVATESGLFYFTVRATDASAEPLTDVQPLDITLGITCGDANTDGQANVADAVYMINFVFKEGPAPAIHDAADANADGDLNVADAVYLINYVFKAGPAPLCP